MFILDIYNTQVTFEDKEGGLHSKDIEVNIQSEMNEYKLREFRSSFNKCNQHITLTKLLIDSLDAKEKNELLLDIERGILEEI